MAPRHVRLVWAAGVLAAAGDLAAADAAAPPADADELLLFEDLPVVVSASRQETPLHLAPAPVSIVSDDDLRFGLFPTLAESFVFTPGVHALAVDRNRFAIGVRGLHDLYSDRTLTLIEGRPADSPIYGGSEFPRLPLFLADIDRIEVVRGPGSATWGPNAFTGVINVIMKEPDELPPWYASATASQLGDAYLHLRHAGDAGPWAWRLSLGYQGRNDSDDALGTDAFSSEDWGRTLKLDSEAVLRLDDDTRLAFGLGASRVEAGVFDYLFAGANSADEDEQILHNVRAFARLDHRTEAGHDLRLQWSGNFADTDIPVQSDVESLENDLSVELRLRQIDAHQLVVGGNVRYVLIDDDGEPEEHVTASSNHSGEAWLGAFVLDRWQASDALLVDAQLRVDHYSESETSLSGRLAALYALDPREDHVLRLAVARAVRAPLLAVRDIGAVRGTMPRLILAPATDDVENEHTYSAEIGYFGALDRWSLRLDGYYQRFEDLIGYVREVAGADVIFRPANIDGATSWGAEAEVAWEHGPWRTSAWYTHHAFSKDSTPQSIRAFEPPQHSAGATLRWRIDQRLVANLNYRYSDATDDADETDVPSWHRLDLVLSGAWPGSGIGYAVGVHDLFDDTELEIAGSGDSAPHPVPGRTFLARLTWAF